MGEERENVGKGSEALTKGEGQKENEGREGPTGVCYVVNS